MPSPCDLRGLRGTPVLLLRRDTHRGRIVAARRDRASAMETAGGAVSDFAVCTAEERVFPSIEMYCTARSNFDTFDVSLDL